MIAPLVPPMTPSPRRGRSWSGWLASATLMLATALGADPAGFTWNSAVDGNWSDAAKWTDDQALGSAPVATGQPDYSLEFSVEGSYTASQDLNAGFRLNLLRFGGSAVTLAGNTIQFVTNGAALPAILQDGEAAVTIATPVSLTADLSLGGSGSGLLTIDGAVTGTGGLAKSGVGVVSLTGANSYRGNTTIAAGALHLALPNSGNDKSVLAIAAGATLDLEFTGSDTVGALVLAGVAQPDGIYNAANSGGAITGAGSILVVTPLPSSNASLSSLVVGSASLSPAFNPLTGSYSASVPNSVSTITVKPTVAGEGATATVNGTAVSTGTASGPIALSVGPNLITTLVRAQDGITTRTYTVNVNRASAAVVSTAPAVVIDASRATLNGDVNPNGVSTVYFEYGTTADFGSRTPDRDVSGLSPRAFAASVTGLKGATTYHFRAVLFNAGGTIYGGTRQFTTVPNPPVAATGAPANVTASTATFIGAVNPNGVQASAYFEYGLTTAYGQSTPVQKIAAGTGTVSVQALNLPLIPNASYHYRLVASNSAGTAFGNDVLFSVKEGGGSGSGAPTAVPEVATGEAAAIGTESVVLVGTVNPNGGTTLVEFDYGSTPAYGMTTVLQGVGNGTTSTDVAIPLQGLLPGTTYHYRLTGSNELGASSGADATFTTAFPPPTAVTGGSTVLTTTSVRIDGEVRARGDTVEVWIDYGTDGISFNSARGLPADASGDQSTAVSAELTDLAQGVTYYFRVRAVGANGEGTGETKTFEVSSLSGLIQQYPPPVPLAERQGSLTITLGEPAVEGSGWRFAGEQFWRESGIAATGLTGGDRVVEYRPVPGFTRPPNEAVAVTGSSVPASLVRSYMPTADVGDGSLIVFLKPQDLTENVALARWRFFGEGDADWKPSGEPVGGLVPGNYVIECKPVEGRSTPAPVTASVENGATASITITYYIADELVGTAPVMVPFESFSGDTTLPHAFVGQIRGDAGSGTGFVVRPRVVATVGHVVFDDGTLAITTGLQWLFQRDRGVHDPVPRTPRGSYLMTGYAAQRILDDSPGVSSPESQNLDAATLFFLDDVGRGGFSGYVASDTSVNEFLDSDAPKTLVGYPVDGIPEADLDRLHATAPADIAFTKAFGRTYTTADIRSSGGASGAPLCVLAENGTYYPAAIYLGGTGQTVVRALDSEVVELIAFADASSGDGVGVNGGSQTSTATEPYANPELAALKVVIEPASARAAGAGWRIGSQSAYLPSDSQSNDLAPGDYTIRFPVLEGFVPPSPQTVTLGSGLLTTITFAYESTVTPPQITSAGTAGGIRGEAFSYQILAANSPALFTLIGVLPAGLEFDPGSGLISGLLDEAGVFTVDIGASNSGGAASRKLEITSLPVLADQSATRPYLVPMTYAPVSSESGAGVAWSATGLPGDLSIHPASGVISGIPRIPGVYQIPLAVTTRGARSTATFTLTVTGTPPVFTLQPVAARSLQYGTTTTLAADASGLPAPDFQWYEGPGGNTDVPVPGATSNVFTTPPVSTSTSFWVRASSISGSADSSATAITVLPSANANLTGLFTSAGPVSPAFNLGVTAYFLSVPNDVSAIQLTPLAEIAQSAVRVAGVLVPVDAASEPVELAVGSNLINIDVTAGNGTTTKRYTLAVTRAVPPSVATGAATEVTDSSATLRGSATPNGPGTVFFQYGTTAAFGSATPGQEISGTPAVAIEAPLSGLAAEVTYHYRIGITTGAGTIFGGTLSFTTPKAPPLVATGQASDVAEGEVRLIGAVDPNGTPTTVYFQYSALDAAVPFSLTTPPMVNLGGSSVIDVESTVAGLLPGIAYRYRLVGSSSAGIAYGEEVIFIPGQANGGSGTPVAAPVVATLDALAATSSTALLQGTANPQGGTTFVRFDYGLTPDYGKSTPARGIGSGSETATVTQQVSGLLAGSTYHYRLVAFNSFGISEGEDRVFTTGFLDPQATTGSASPLSTSIVRVNGAVRARGATVDVFFEYGTDGVNFPLRIRAAEGTVSGDAEVPVRADLGDLQPGTTYYYRTVASRTGDPASSGTGLVKTFASDALIGLFQKFPRELDVIERQGQIQVNLLPPGTGKWRFAGEVEWRESGAIATGMTTGDRDIEFLPVAGYLQPGRELVGVISGAPTLVLEREYFQSAVPGDSGLRVFLEPASRVAAMPTSARVQWRLAGETVWRDSGTSATGLMPGSYLVNFKAAQGLNAPPPATLVVARGELRSAAFAYNPDLDVPSSSMRTLSYDTLSTTRNLPYAYVGQIRSDAGSHSGFVVKPRVVATVAQAVFDEVTLSQVPGVQWMFQRDREVHEPKPQTPRGFYVFDGYAAQRESEQTPGSLSLEAQGLNAAAIYFLGDAGRGGYSGFLAGDTADSPLGDAGTLKVLTGYPVQGGSSTSNFGRMQSTRPAPGGFTALSPAVFGTTAVQGLNGMKGGPLSIQRDGGSYYPVGIYLGGSNASDLYRVIDGGVIDLFNRAEATANTGNNNNSGGISQTSYTAVSTTSTKGSLTVILEPAEARTAGALWKLGTDASFLASGSRKNNLTPGDYVVQFKQVAGFQAVPQQSVAVLANNLTTVTLTYLPELSELASWRVVNFGSTSNAGSAADGEDPDGDGSSNLDEYSAGTDPLDPADVFRVISAERVGTGFSAVVKGRAGRTYALQRRADLTGGAWENVASAGPLVADGDLTLTDPGAVMTQGFYRVTAEATGP